MTSPFVPVSRRGDSNTEIPKLELYQQTQALCELNWKTKINVLPLDVKWHKDLSDYIRKQIQLCFAIVEGAHLCMRDSIQRAQEDGEAPLPEAEALERAAVERRREFLTKLKKLNESPPTDQKLTTQFKAFIYPANQDAARAFCWTEPSGVIDTEDDFNWARLEQTLKTVQKLVEDLHKFADRRNLKQVKTILERVETYVGGSVERRTTIRTLAMQFLMEVARCLVEQKEPPVQQVGTQGSSSARLNRG